MDSAKSRSPAPFLNLNLSPDPKPHANSNSNPALNLPLSTTPPGTQTNLDLRIQLSKTELLLQQARQETDEAKNVNNYLLNSFVRTHGSVPHLDLTASASTSTMAKEDKVAKNGDVKVLKEKLEKSEKEREKLAIKLYEMERGLEVEMGMNKRFITTIRALKKSLDGVTGMVNAFSRMMKVSGHQSVVVRKGSRRGWNGEKRASRLGRLRKVAESMEYQPDALPGSDLAGVSRSDGEGEEGEQSVKIFLSQPSNKEKGKGKLQDRSDSNPRESKGKNEKNEEITKVYLMDRQQSKRQTEKEEDKTKAMRKLTMFEMTDTSLSESESESDELEKIPTIPSSRFRPTKKIVGNKAESKAGASEKIDLTRDELENGSQRKKATSSLSTSESLPLKTRMSKEEHERKAGHNKSVCETIDLTAEEGDLLQLSAEDVIPTAKQDVTKPFNGNHKQTTSQEQNFRSSPGQSAADDWTPKPVAKEYKYRFVDKNDKPNIKAEDVKPKPRKEEWQEKWETRGGVAESAKLDDGWGIGETQRRFSWEQEPPRWRPESTQKVGVRYSRVPDEPIVLDYDGAREGQSQQTLTQQGSKPVPVVETGVKANKTRDDSPAKIVTNDYDGENAKPRQQNPEQPRKSTISTTETVVKRPHGPDYTRMGSEHLPTSWFDQYHIQFNPPAEHVPKTRRTVVISNIPPHVTLSSILSKVVLGPLVNADLVQTSFVPLIVTSSADQSQAGDVDREVKHSKVEDHGTIGIGSQTAMLEFVFSRQAEAFAEYARQNEPIFFPVSGSNTTKSHAKASVTHLKSPTHPLPNRLSLFLFNPSPNRTKYTRTILIKGYPPLLPPKSLFTSLRLDSTPCQASPGVVRIWQSVENKSNLKVEFKGIDEASWAYPRYKWSIWKNLSVEFCEDFWGRRLNEVDKGWKEIELPEVVQEWDYQGRAMIAEKGASGSNVAQTAGENLDQGMITTAGSGDNIEHSSSSKPDQTTNNLKENLGSSTPKLKNPMNESYYPKINIPTLFPTKPNTKTTPTKSNILPPSPPKQKREPSEDLTWWQVTPNPPEATTKTSPTKTPEKNQASSEPKPERMSADLGPLIDSYRTFDTSFSMADAIEEEDVGYDNDNGWGGAFHDSPEKGQSATLGDRNRVERVRSYKSEGKREIVDRDAPKSASVGAENTRGRWSGSGYEDMLKGRRIVDYSDL